MNMKNTVTVDGNKTLGEGDDGTIQYIGVNGTIKFPNESNWKFKKGDEFIVISDVDGNVSITGEEGVTFIPKSITLTAKGKNANVKYEGDNKYLIWGVLFITLIVAASNYFMNIVPDSLIMLVNGIK